MILDRISILNFKNIEEAGLSFSPKMNCFFGNNGMGKTNLLDALYYLSFTKNHTNLLDSQLIKHEQDFCVLQGFYCEGETAEEIYCGIKRKQKKVFKRNKKEYERLSDHIGLIPLVMISPSDSDLIHGGSDERRKFADMLICQCDKEYLHALIRYNKALHQRNCLLREAPDSTDASLFEVLEEQLIHEGETVYNKRKEFITDFIPVFKEYYRTIADESEPVDLQYDSQLNSAPFAQWFADRREKDKLLGYTGAGIHKDDFHFLLENYLIRKIGSQGQCKTYLIALKLAQFNFLVRKKSTFPILLLDDIFDKLDAGRVEQIIRLLLQPEFGQIFITDTNRKYLDEILEGLNHDYKLFRVNGGIINEWQ
ncbi:MAG: DNA replication and repair protein RecF [Dysgonamonadaceae bacterium]|jgi:DNA replication and repair protein RecF|nr:DNA replication and repair protein RecF [Dysgonamonadaceae bacterium]